MLYFFEKLINSASSEEFMKKGTANDIFKIFSSYSQFNL